jgi:hypothetical protein
MIAKSKRRTRTALRGLVCIAPTLVIIWLLAEWIAVPVGRPWSLVISFAIGVTVGTLMGRATAPWVLKPLDEGLPR